MAREYFTHLGVACEILYPQSHQPSDTQKPAVMNPGGPKSVSGTAYSVSDLIQEGTDELLESLENPNFGNRRQLALKAFVRSVATQEQPPGSPFPHRRSSVTAMPVY